MRLLGRIIRRRIAAARECQRPHRQSFLELKDVIVSNRIALTKTVIDQGTRTGHQLLDTQGRITKLARDFQAFAEALSAELMTMNRRQRVSAEALSAEIIKMSQRQTPPPAKALKLAPEVTLDQELAADDAPGWSRRPSCSVLNTRHSR